MPRRERIVGLGSYENEQAMDIEPKELARRYEPKQVREIKPDRQMLCVRISPCGKLLAAASADGTIRRWNLADEALPELPPLAGHSGWVTAIAFARKGQRLVACDSWGAVSCWSYAEETPKQLWLVEQAHDGWIRGLAVSPDGKQIATCGFDRQVRVWSAEDGKRTNEFSGHQEDVFSVAFHPDGKSLVSGDLKGHVRQWDLASGQETRKLDCQVLYQLSRLQDVGGVRVLSFNADGSQLACAGLTPKNGGNVQGTPTILLFDWASGQLKHTIKVGNDGDAYVYDVHFHADGFLMAVTSGNPGTGKLLFIRPGDAQPFYLSTKMPNCHSLAIHPDGRRLVVSATNGGSNGNGRNLKDGSYPGNWSPLYLLEMPLSEAAGKPAG
jgi:sugar lactone lactonase YvrE